MAEPTDEEFVELLRAATAGYLRAVDEWEEAYNRYYRLPEHAHTISSDMEQQQREYDAQHRNFKLLLPRAGQLCLKYGLANPFPGLLRSSLGQYAPQQRVESAISRNERSAVAACLEKLAAACHGELPAARPEPPIVAGGRTATATPRSKIGRAMTVAVIGGLALTLVITQWPRIRAAFPASLEAADDQPYGRRSGNEMGAAFEAERQAKSAKLSDADLQRMVERLFIQDDPGRTNFHGLLYAGARPLPFLIKALDDPRTWNTVFEKKGFDPLEVSPFSRLCSLLSGLNPPEAVPSLTRYVDHPDSMFRQQAASLLAHIGTAQCLEPVKKALADQDSQVREFALMGLGRGVNTPHREASFAAGIFPMVAPLLNAGVYSTMSPAAVLMELDPVKATAVLESPKYFSVRNPQLREVLEALDRTDVKVPHEILFPLLEKLEPLAAADSREELAYAAALSLYANNPDDRAESRFLTLLQAPGSWLASTAAHCLEMLTGINPHDAVWDVYNKRGFLAMTKPQQLYFAVEIYRDEVDNGGHNQYFYNDDSDLFQTAVEGLRTIGAPTLAANLSTAGSAFGGSPPPREAPRRRQMEDFGPVQSRIFETADQRFYTSEKEPGERLDVLLTLYAMKHRGDFKSESAAPR
jgi:Domain of unknown function (DUF4375)/HEAT repeats